MKILKNGKSSSVVYGYILLIASSGVGTALATSTPVTPLQTAVQATSPSPSAQVKIPLRPQAFVRPASVRIPLRPPEQLQPYSASVWAAMSTQFQFNYEDSHPEVMAQIAKLQAHKKELYKELKREAPYINYFFKQTQKHGLPAELALLLVMESDCDPESRSPVGAVGWWQLMPGTAHDLGLNCNPGSDQRKDIVASTEAALNFLNDLHKTMQDDWMLALAAYNTGPGNVNKAIKRQKKWYKRIGFWELHLAAETEAYVPKLVALAAVIRDPGRYGIELPPTIDVQMPTTRYQDNEHSPPAPTGTVVAHAANSSIPPVVSRHIRAKGVSSALMDELSTSVANI